MKRNRERKPGIRSKAVWGSRVVANGRRRAARAARRAR
jgi:hypothetical protein